MLQAKTTDTTIAPTPGAYALQAVNSIVSLFQAPAANDGLTITSCPCCGSTPAIDPSFHNRAVIYCDDDACEDRPQAMGDTVALAAATWNQRIEDGELV